MPDEEYDDIVAAATGKVPRRHQNIDYRSLYQDVGTRYGIDPDLLYRQAAQESANFNPHYVFGPGRSPKGAAGLAQFMPDTARQYGLVVAKGRDDRFDPVKAADAHGRLMRDLLDKYNGDQQLALAAYNSGTNKTLQQARRAMQQIPETRGYVAKIAPNASDPYDDIISAATTDDYSDVIAAATPQPAAGRGAGYAGVTRTPKRGLRTRQPVNLAELQPEALARLPGGQAMLELARSAQPVVPSPPAPRRSTPAFGLSAEQTKLAEGIPTEGLARRIAIRKQVEAENAVRQQQQALYSKNPAPARTSTEVDQEVESRVATEQEAESRRRELLDQLTPGDKALIADAVNRMRGQGSVSRGIETGSQRIGSGLLYKLAGLTDVVGGNRPEQPNVLGNYLRRQAGRGELAVEQIESEMPPEAAQQWADFLTSSLGTLPEIYGATAAGGPIGGFAALGGLEALGRKRSFAEVAKETAKGAVIGGVFRGAGAFESPGEAAEKSLLRRVGDTASSGAVIGAGTFATEKAFGADDATAAQSALANVAFHVGGRAPELVGRFAQAAERALKTPDTGGPRPTVPDTLQDQLTRAAAVAAPEGEIPPAARTPPAAPVVDTLATGSAEVVPPTSPAGAWRVRIPLPDGSMTTEQFNTEAEARARASKTPAPTELPTETPPLETPAPVEAPRPSFADLMTRRAEAGPEATEAPEQAARSAEQPTWRLDQPSVKLSPKEREWFEWAESGAKEVLTDPDFTRDNPDVDTVRGQLEDMRYRLEEQAADMISGAGTVEQSRIERRTLNSLLKKLEGAKYFEQAEQPAKPVESAVLDREVGEVAPNVPVSMRWAIDNLMTPEGVRKLASADLSKYEGSLSEQTKIDRAITDAKLDDKTLQGIAKLTRHGPSGFEQPLVDVFKAIKERAASVEQAAKPVEAAKEDVLRRAENMTGSGTHDLAESILRSPEWKSRVLGELGEGAEPLPYSGSTLKFRTKSGEQVTIQNAADSTKPPTIGTKRSGLVIERAAKPVEGEGSRYRVVRGADAYRLEDTQTPTAGGPFEFKTVKAGRNKAALDAEATRLNRTKPPRAEGGYVDLNEIREGVKAGKVKVEDAVEQLRNLYGRTYGYQATRGPASTDKMRAVLARDRDPLIGVVTNQGVSALEDPLRAQAHSIVFRESLRQSPQSDQWRYEPRDRTVYWDDTPSAESKAQVAEYLSKQGLEVADHKLLPALSTRSLWENEIADLDRPHHSTQQPRTPTGQFSPGEPGGPEAERAMMRTEARKYQEQYRSLDQHLARREGLDIVNDDVARDYFRRLRRMAADYLPNRIEAVDRAENFYNQGQYSKATQLAEPIFGELPDQVNRLSGAIAASELAERGTPIKSTEWRQVIAEVRRRLERTGGLSGGGSTFYDVNKRPEGGRADHEKIAYILEPVIDAIRNDAARLIAEGKLKVDDYVKHVRTEINKMLATSDFADWHPLNKSAALGVLVDKLRAQGPPVGGSPTGPELETGEPRFRERSLPKTLERSGREPGTDLTYEVVPNAKTIERVARRMSSEGPEQLEQWARTAPPSADRTEAFRQLVDHYMAKSVADNSPELRERAVELTNLEVVRATEMGQAVQAYSMLNKYTPVGVAKEIASLQAKGHEIPAAVIKDLSERAVEFKQADKDVKRLEKEVAEAEVEEGEVVGVGTGAGKGPGKGAGPGGGGRTTGGGEGPEGTGERGPRKPRQYKPRGDQGVLLQSKSEKARIQLDEAAKRRRAAKVAMARQLRAIEQSRTVSGYWKRSMNITRGLMVSAVSTAMRNLQSQAIRFDVERLTDLVEHGLRRSVGLNSDFTTRNIWRDTLRQFKSSEPFAREILGEHPGELFRMFSVNAAGVDVPLPTPAKNAVERVFQTVEKGVELANFANRAQEFHLRSVEFLAELDLHLRKEKNESLEQFVRRHGVDAIPLDIVRKGVDKALEVTFADMPMRDRAGGRLLTSIIEVGNYLPPTLSPVAFPRFMFNNLKFLYQYNPTGLIDVAYNRTGNRPRALARSIVGSSMLLLAYQFRKSDHAGEKWYELKFGDTTVDARPFGPFSTYLFIAEAIRRSLNHEKQFSLDEIAQAAGASVLGAGTGLALAERLYSQISNGDWDKLQRTIKQEGGEWGRALLTPVRQTKDLIAAFDASQAVTRDTSSEPFLGPLRESIPYASKNFPEAHRPTTATPIRQEHPAVKAITGWRVETPKTFLEHQLDELDFQGSEIRTNTGVPKIDSLEKQLMGPRMDQLSKQLETDEEFKKSPRATRAKILKDAMEEIRSEVRELGEAEHPELYQQLREQRKSRRDKEFEKQQPSPGVSRAIRLGVPMTIPPRGANEDDIAYRARLLQLGRTRAAALDAAVNAPAFDNLALDAQRAQLREALYS